MRLLHVITRLELGGAQQNTLATCRGLAARGHEVVLAYGPGGMLDAEVEGAAYRAVPLEALRREIHPLHDARALLALTRLVRDLQPDVLHDHSSKAGVLGRLAGRAGGARFVVHGVHGWSFAHGQPAATRAAYRLVERACSLLTDHFACVSALDLEEGRRLGIIRGDRASVIRSGFDLAAFAPGGPGRERVRAEWSVETSDVLVVNVSNFKRQKAPLDFVRAAGEAARLDPRLRFAFVGDGPLRPDVVAAVAEENLGSRMVLAGWRRDVADILRAADVVALTSLWEGLPRTLVQARASARPVVATRVNGTPEVVVPEVNGLLVEPGDVGAIAAAFVRLARDPDLRARLGAAGPVGIEDFAEERMVDLQESLYRRLMQQRLARHLVGDAPDEKATAGRTSG